MIRESQDEGLSLIELVIYVVVLGIVSVAVLSMLLSTWRTQAAVTDQTTATTRGQLVSSQIEKAMRNAIGFRVSSDGTTLWVNTSLADSSDTPSPTSGQCQAFFLTGTEDDPGDARMTMSKAPGNTDAPADWARLQDGVAAQIDSSDAPIPFFTSVDATGTAAGTSGVAYRFEAVGADPSSPAGAVSFSGTAFRRNPTDGGMAPCWPSMP